jgi:hypothetical protein
MDEPAWYGGGTSLFFVHDVPQFDANGQWLSDSMTLEGLSLANGSRSVLMKNARNPTTAPNGALAWMAINAGTLGFQLNYTADGSTVKTLVSDKDCWQISQPRLSPDGQWIAFSCSGPKGAGSGGGGPFGLFGIANLSLIPSASAHGLPWDPFVIKTDGTGLRRLAGLGSDEQAVAWSPDSQTVSLAYFDGVFDVPLAGGPLTRIMGGGDPGALDWKAGA